jgi:hypothetical protein
MRPQATTRRARAIESVRSLLRERYPTLRVVGDALPATVVGSFPVEYEGETLGRFLVEIELPSDYPRVRPIVREVGGEIPHDLEHHNPKGVACLFHPAAYWLDGYDKRPLSDFLQGPVLNFFMFQCCKRLGVPWPHGEQAHGTAGALEFFCERLRVDERTALRCVKALAQKALTRHSRCPCGSMRSVRKCHRAILRFAERVPRSVFQVLTAQVEAKTEVAA